MPILITMYAYMSRLKNKYFTYLSGACVKLTYWLSKNRTDALIVTYMIS